MADSDSWAWVGGTSKLIDSEMNGTKVQLGEYEDDFVFNDADDNGLIADNDGVTQSILDEGVTIEGVFHQVEQFTTFESTASMGDGTSLPVTLHVFRLDDGTLIYRLRDGQLLKFHEKGFGLQDIREISLDTMNVDFENLRISNHDDPFPDSEFETQSSQNEEIDAQIISHNTSDLTNSDGVNHTETAMVDTFPLCFCAGSLIRTANGEERVETLEKGDLIWTADCGYQPILWVASSRYTARDLDRQDNLRPVVIPKGALGVGVPERDLKVSAQHRILLNTKILRVMEGVDEVFVAAKKLIGYNGIRYLDHSQDISYFHLGLHKHHVVMANGTKAESFLVTEFSFRNISNKARLVLLAACAVTKPDDFFMEPVRPILRNKGRIRRLCFRCHKNGLSLVEFGQEGHSCRHPSKRQMFSSQVC